MWKESKLLTKAKAWVPDLKPQDPHDSLQWKYINCDSLGQYPNLDHSGHMAYSSTQPWKHKNDLFILL